jgi:hypothetical protein
MKALHFDALTKSLCEGLSRRGLVGGFVSGLMGSRMIGHSQLMEARNRRRTQKHKRRRKRKQKQGQGQPLLNAFGCVDVGQKCFGRGDLCCTGRCEGTPPRNGGPDERRCAAHDTGGCQAGQRPSGCGGVDTACTTTSGSEGACNTTTGKSGFCAAAGDCFPCAKDADCQGLCGPGAACVVCAESCSGTGGTACLGPGPCEGF